MEAFFVFRLSFDWVWKSTQRNAVQVWNGREVYRIKCCSDFGNRLEDVQSQTHVWSRSFDTALLGQSKLFLLRDFKRNIAYYFSIDSGQLGMGLLHLLWYLWLQTDHVVSTGFWIHVWVHNILTEIVKVARKDAVLQEQLLQAPRSAVATFTARYPCGGSE